MCELASGDSCGATAQDVGSDQVDFQPSSQVGNPINVITGNKYQRESDYQSSVSKLQFNRYYNSYNTDWNAGFGQGWSSSYSTKLFKISNGGFQVTQGTGQAIPFVNVEINNAGIEIYRADNPALGCLYKKEDKYVWKMLDGRLFTFQGSYLVRIDFSGVQFLKLFYRNKKLAEISDEAGRLLLLEYYSHGKGLADYIDDGFGEQPNLLAKLTLPDGTSIEYDYDNKKNMTRAR